VAVIEREIAKDVHSVVFSVHVVHDFDVALHTEGC
jgi:hypothetical protein